MNIELYIQSGVVESYAFGLATPQEATEFEQLLPHYPELRDALTDFEYQLELFAIDHEIPPAPEYISVESSSTHIWVHKSWRTWFIIFCLLSKIFIALFVYYFVEYRFAQKQIQQLEEQLGKKEQVRR